MIYEEECLMPAVLKKVQIQQLKTKILTQQKTIRQLEKNEKFSNSSRHGTVKVTPTNPDENMNDVTINASINMETHYLDTMAEIDHALKNISNDSYGICIDCGENIGFSRLNAYPTARRCISCKADFERIHQDYA